MGVTGLTAPKMTLSMRVGYVIPPTKSRLNTPVWGSLRSPYHVLL